MNNAESIEIGLAEKLLELPAPDMADAIWKSIEQQLDNGLQGKDRVDTTEHHPDGGNSKGYGWALSVAAIIAITVLIGVRFSKSDRGSDATKELPVKTPPQEEKFISYPENITGYKKAVSQPARTFRKKNDSIKENLPLRREDTLGPPVPVSSARDTSIIVFPHQAFGPALLTPDTMPPRKPKGVKGITGADYKIKSQDISPVKGG